MTSPQLPAVIAAAPSEREGDDEALRLLADELRCDDRPKAAAIVERARATLSTESPAPTAPSAEPPVPFAGQYKPQEGTWELRAPDGTSWHEASPMDCLKAEMHDRIPAHVALARIWAAVDAEPDESATPAVAPAAAPQEAPSEPMVPLREVERILKGIEVDECEVEPGEPAFWETSTGAEWGQQMMAEIRALASRGLGSPLRREAPAMSNEVGTAGSIAGTAGYDLNLTPPAEKAGEDAVRGALAELCKYFPTDSDMIDLDWEKPYIDAACNAYDRARTALDQTKGEK